MKKTIYENYRVEAFPDVWPSSPTHKKYIDILGRIQESIERHVDEVRDVCVEWDRREICEFCSEKWELWEDGEEAGLPACCDKAFKEAKCEAHLKELNGEKKCQT